MNPNNLIRSQLKQGNAFVDHQLLAFTEGKEPILVVEHGHIEPTSIDLKVKSKGKAYQLPFLPPITPDLRISELLKLNQGYKTFDIDNCPTLSQNSLYLVELEARLKLPPFYRGFGNAKSNSGRLDLYTSLLVDGAPGYDELPEEFEGSLYMPLSTQSNPIDLHPDQSFVQLRLFKEGRRFLDKWELERINEEFPLLADGQKPTITSRGLLLHLDLGNGAPYAIGRNNGMTIDTAKRGYYNPKDFYYQKPLEGDCLTLDRDEFLLAVSEEKVQIPSFLCAEMVAQHESRGPFRAHAAGFIDPGYGRNGGQFLTCEIRNLAPFKIGLKNGQRVALLRFERLLAIPEALYGEGDRVEPSHFDVKRIYPKQFL